MTAKSFELEVFERARGPQAHFSVHCPSTELRSVAAYIAMYVRVKRQKTTIFLLTSLQESVLEVKSKLQKHLDGKVRSTLSTRMPQLASQRIGTSRSSAVTQDPADMKLVKVSTGGDLDDARTLADLKIQNDDVLGLCFKTEASGGAPDCL
jgi:hypothetical protein